ncbi:unnamed protein product [Musa acuminata subsp. malaccensis]|uniref:(wild Malaysian banana) hypothetical protein n=1 Tax=Musa acuminata subsp. malaccensis TaxID=214687 RepID=A0A804HUV5_MUSAM|nr:unnamed protein product [Musa acuminata subsp. malaccensis]
MDSFGKSLFGLTHSDPYRVYIRSIEYKDDHFFPSLIKYANKI